jgi:aspartate-semialdehyde dehydrogenase
VDAKVKLALVGAGGVVGREVLGALLAAGVEAGQLTLLGSERSAGEEVEYGEETLALEPLEEGAFRGQHVVILATPAEASRKLAAGAQAAGAWVVDVSAAFRAEPGVPLVLPGVNDAALDAGFKGRIVSVPSAVSTALALLCTPLLPLGLQRVHVTALLGASSAGMAGVRELEQHTAALLSGRDSEPGRFPHRLALNFIPQVGAFVAETGDTEEERSWYGELLRLWGDKGAAVRVTGTAVQVPTFFGHGLSVLLEGRGLDVDGVRGALKGSGALKLLDEPGERVYPMPMLVTADEAVHVGRLRRTPGGVQLFATVDNALRGGALAAVQVAERLSQRR